VLEEKPFTQEVCARRNRDASLARVSPHTLFSLGSVFCEQRDVTFEVTDVSFCAATCQVYKEA
jgi:hypothetical protein